MCITLVHTYLRSPCREQRHDKVQTIVLCENAIRQQDVNPCIRESQGRILNLHCYSIVPVNDRCINCRDENPSPSPPALHGPNGMNAPGGTNSDDTVSESSTSESSMSDLHIRGRAIHGAHGAHGANGVW